MRPPSPPSRSSTAAAGAFWPSFSLEGSRIAYIITNPMNRQQTALVVDGKPAGYPAGGLANVGGSGYEPRFTPDGTHLLVYGMAPGALQVLIDGRPFLKAPDAHLFMTPAGNAFVTRITGMDRVSFLDIGGRKVPGSEGQVIDSVYFSADGKHWAARIQTPANTKFVLADGKKGLSNKHVRAWPEIFAADEILTTAILDRLLHHVAVVHIDGQSYRLRELGALLSPNREGPRGPDSRPNDPR